MHLTWNAPPPPASDDELARLRTDYAAVRDVSRQLCAPLCTEDYCIQTMPDVSPPKWHLAHTSWFFEQFVLLPYLAGYKVHHPRYDYLFNSYYVTHGTPYPRPQRGLLSRPTVEEIYAYRAHVDAAIAELLDAVPEPHFAEVVFRTRLGLNHEQQHQELLLTDIKHIFAHNPLRPVYAERARNAPAAAAPLGWHELSGGIAEIGASGEGFVYDNETPRHRVWLDDFALASRPVTNGEYLAFMDDGGYRRPEFWLSDGWAAVNANAWEAPLYWERRDGDWWHMTLAGMQPVDAAAPVCHVSCYEASAYAAWVGARLPTEAEWERCARDAAIEGNLLESGHLQPVAADSGSAPAQLFGDVWEWTASAYAPYPGYQPLADSLGEYNGKFMSSQMVLRGGSCVTSRSHIRASYRNFFYPGDRWQFSGIRLGADR